MKKSSILEARRKLVNPEVQKKVDLAFLVTRVGCGIAGFTNEEISPLFAKAHEVENIVLPSGW